MGKYFGTDGIRGKANLELTAETAFLIGRALGHLYPSQKIVVGMDTRLSSSMLKHALMAGVCASGAHVYDTDVVPTPAIAYLTTHEDFVCGVMISASHNPYYDNGIKIFNTHGVKIDDALEAKIEAVIDGEKLPYAMSEHIGIVHDFKTGLNHYKQWLSKLFDMNLSGIKIAIDASNGSASVTALEVLEALGAECTIMHNEPNGVNINDHCGSTHPETLQTFVKAHGFDLGLAFDGDADRLIAVDHEGELVDGDKIIYICGTYLNEKGLLNAKSVVTTVMANLGLYKALKDAGITSEQTQVGDKYVYERMLQKDLVLGGEQSGHIIFKQHATTGDGLLTALKLLEVMHAKKDSLRHLGEPVVIFPQVLKNVKVNDKKAALSNPVLKARIDEMELDLHGEGRILVRPSGTEPLVRVMVEAASIDKCHACCDELVEMIHTLKL